MNGMKTLLQSFIVCALAINTALAYSEYVYLDEPLIQAQFDRLIPTSYPTIETTFDQLRPTTWPLLHPGIPQIHITENLIHPTDQALLIVY
jgi:hypothetical protein